MTDFSSFMEIKMNNFYPTKVEPFMRLEDYSAQYERIEAGQTLAYQTAIVAGRVVGIRNLGKVSFLDLMHEHKYVQLYLKKDTTPNYDALVSTLARSDWVCAKGNPCKTKRGELSLLVQNLDIMCKPAKEIPFGKVEKGTAQSYNTVADQELLRRWPELAMATSAVTYATHVKRSKIISAIRRFYEKNDFLEAPIPVIEREYGGASARPFLTKVNALSGMELPLRISHELTLKRLCVGGLPRVYHLGPAFRNEGIDADHHPEFLLTESYAINQDYFDVMKLFESLVAYVIQEVNGTTIARFGTNKMDFTPPWKRITMVDSICEFGGLDVNKMSQLELMAAAVRCNRDVLEQHSISPDLCDSELIDRAVKETKLPINSTWGNLVAYLFEQLVEPKLTQPTIVYDHPKETTPLCKKHRDPKLADKFIERFEAFAGCGVDKTGIVGSELANAYTELNDPIEQRNRMEEQARQRAEGNEEAYPPPEEFITSVEYGLPPLGGLGFGVDRLTMIAVGELYPPEKPPRIQDVVLFPLMTPITK